MKTIYSLATMMVLTGCETVEMQYTEPATQGDFAAVEAQANDHYEYFVFPKSYVLVTPVQSSTGKSTISQDNTAPAENNAGQEKSDKAGSKVKTKAGANADKDQNPPAKDTTALPMARPSITNGLAKAVIDGQEWEAKVVLLPDDTRTMAVKGVSGFWKSTSVGITKYENTDMVASVSTTAENLVPKRLGQIASVVSTAIQVAGLIPVDGGPKKQQLPLESFVAEVPIKQTKINKDWSYSIKYDNPTPPAGTISFEAFKSQAMKRSVPYWPVPACRNATLELHRNSDNSDYAFHITTSTTDTLRLQPLSIKGKLELGSICGATVSGEIVADKLSTLSDDLQAVKQAVQTIKDAKTPADADTGAKKPEVGSATKK